MKAKAFLKDIAESYGYKNDTESSVIQKDTHYKQLLLLRERAEKEKKIKKKKVFFCQDSIYKKFYRLLKEGYTVKEAKRLLMAEYKINRNMLNRDLTEIQKYFEKNDSKWWTQGSYNIREKEMIWTGKSAKLIESNDNFLEFLRQTAQSESEEYRLLKNNPCFNG